MGLVTKVLNSMANTNSNKAMGKVIVSLTLTNWVDQVLAERGFIPADEVRSLTNDNALVDTGAPRLCLPVDIIQ